MDKPKPNFDLSEISGMLIQIEKVVVDEDREWFMIRDLEDLWSTTQGTCRKRLLKLVQAGVVKFDRDRLVPNRLNPTRTGMVPTYIIIREET